MKSSASEPGLRHKVKTSTLHIDFYTEIALYTFTYIIPFITALQLLKCFVPANILLVLYKRFVLSHFEYCNSLLIGVNTQQKLEDANHYGLRTIMNMGKILIMSLSLANVNSLEHRRIE